MATTAGVLSKISSGQTVASLSSAVATGGTAPYTYQWYRSTVSGFTPGAGNIITGATSLTLSDTGLSAATQYYYAVIATDVGSVADASDQLAVATTAASVSSNQFVQASLCGLLDLRFNSNTLAAEIGPAQSGSLVAGQAVKIVDSAGGVPKVVACAANSDEVFGFINYDVKSQAFAALDKCEISQSGNVIFLQATGAIARGVQVQLDVSSIGGVAQAVGSSGARIVGYSLDKASGGQLIRVKLLNPSFAVA